MLLANEYGYTQWRLNFSPFDAVVSFHLSKSSLNSFVKAVSERDTMSLEEKVKLLKGYGSATEYNGSIRVSLWELVAMIQNGKDVEMTSNLEKSVTPLVKEKLLYTDSKRIVATVQDSELGEIKIDRYIKVIRISALGHKLSQSIIKKVTVHAETQLEKFTKLGLI